MNIVLIEANKKQILRRNNDEKTVLSHEQLLNEIKKRYPLGKAYPWDITDFEEQNPDIDFAKSSNGVSAQYVTIDGEEIWVDKWEYFIYVMRGDPHYFDEAQLNYYVDGVKNLNQGQYEFYYQIQRCLPSLPHNKADEFCRNHYGCSVSKVLFEKGAISSPYNIVDEIMSIQPPSADPVLNYRLERCELPPHIEEVKGYVTEITVLSEYSFISRGC